MLSTPFKKQDASREIAPLLFRLPTLLSALRSPEALAHEGSGIFKTQGSLFYIAQRDFQDLYKKGAATYTGCAASAEIDSVALSGYRPSVRETETEARVRERQRVAEEKRERVGYGHCCVYCAAVRV